MSELVAQCLLDLAGEQLWVMPEVAFQRVPVDDDPILIAIVRQPVAEVLAVGMDLGPKVGDDNGNPCKYLLELPRQTIDRVSDQRLELLWLAGIGHPPKLGH